MSHDVTKRQIEIDREQAERRHAPRPNQSFARLCFWSVFQWRKRKLFQFRYWLYRRRSDGTRQTDSVNEDDSVADGNGTGLPGRRLQVGGFLEIGVRAESGQGIEYFRATAALDHSLSVTDHRWTEAVDRPANWALCIHAPTKVG